MNDLTQLQLCCLNLQLVQENMNTTSGQVVYSITADMVRISNRLHSKALLEFPNEIVLPSINENHQ